MQLTNETVEKERATPMKRASKEKEKNKCTVINPLQMLRRENRKEKNRETLNAGRAWPEAPMLLWGPFSYCIAGECAQSEEFSLSLGVPMGVLLKFIGIQWVKAVAELCL